MTERGRDRLERLTTEPVYPLLWRLAVPSMIGMMTVSVYSMTDTWFIALLDQEQLTAAVGIVFTFVSVIQAIGFWIGYGSGNSISRLIGQKERKAAVQMAATGVELAAVVGIVISAAGFILLRPLSLLLGAGRDEGLMTAVMEYLRITLISVPFMLLSNVLYNQLRLRGSAGASMAGLLAGMLLNMALDPLFILYLGLGVSGAALASLAGQICGTVFLFRMACLDRNVPLCTGRAGVGQTGIGRGGIGWVRIAWVRIAWVRMEGFRIRAILTAGMPNFCRQGVTGMAGLVLNHAAGAFGTSAIAGVTIASRILSMGYALVIGFGQGFQPVCLVNYGAGRLERIQSAFGAALLTVTGFLIIAALLFGTSAGKLASLFSSDAAVIETAAGILASYRFVLPFTGIYILTGMLLQNIGRFKMATLVTIAENGLFLIPLACLMPRLAGYIGLIYCRAAAAMCATVLSIFVTIKALLQGADKKDSRDGAGKEDRR